MSHQLEHRSKKRASIDLCLNKNHSMPRGPGAFVATATAAPVEVKRPAAAPAARQKSTAELIDSAQEKIDELNSFLGGILQDSEPAVAKSINTNLARLDTIQLSLNSTDAGQLLTAEDEASKVYKFIEDQLKGQKSAKEARLLFAAYGTALKNATALETTVRQLKERQEALLPAYSEEAVATGTSTESMAGAVLEAPPFAPPPPTPSLYAAEAPVAGGGRSDLLAQLQNKKLRSNKGAVVSTPTPSFEAKQVQGSTVGGGGGGGTDLLAEIRNAKLRHATARAPAVAKGTPGLPQLSNQAFLNKLAEIQAGTASEEDESEPDNEWAD
jgi:hypothetical protein